MRQAGIVASISILTLEGNTLDSQWQDWLILLLLCAQLIGFYDKTKFTPISTISTILLGYLIIHHIGTPFSCLPLFICVELGCYLRRYMSSCIAACFIAIIVTHSNATYFYTSDGFMYIICVVLCVYIGYLRQVIEKQIDTLCYHTTETRRQINDNTTRIVHDSFYPYLFRPSYKINQIRINNKKLVFDNTQLILNLIYKMKADFHGKLQRIKGVHEANTPWHNVFHKKIDLSHKIGYKILSSQIPKLKLNTETDQIVTSIIEELIINLIKYSGEKYPLRFPLLKTC